MQIAFETSGRINIAMPDLDHPLSETELDELNAILHTPGWPETTLDVSAFDGFLTAIVISPGVVMPSRWLPWLWGTGRVETFPSDATAQRFFGLVMRHMNGISGTFMADPTGFYPLFLRKDETCVVQPRCKGFMIALHHLREDWRPFYDDKEHQREIAPILIGANDDQPEVLQVRHRMESDGVVLADEIAASARLLRAYWWSRRHRNQEAGFPTRPITTVVPAKIGRNEPCPCDGEKLEALIATPAEALRRDRLVLFFPGNAGNISQRVHQLEAFVRTTNAVVLGLGYRGYGASTGQPGERGIYRDAEAALRYAKDALGFAENQIVLCGVSLGSAVAVNTAGDRDFAGVILVTPMTSARELARDHDRGSVAWMAGGAFDSLAKVSRLRSPMLVIHGTLDEVIPFRMGERLFAAIPTPKHFVTIHGARHNNVAFTDPRTFWSAIADFVAAH